VKIHCSVLAEDAIKSAIEDFKKKKAARESLAPPVAAAVSGGSAETAPQDA
jgi:hypothetical protein